MQLIEKNLLQKCRTELRPILEVAIYAATEAGTVIRNLFGTSVSVRHKGDIDLVTEADVAAEKIIIEILDKSTIKASLLAEESHSQYDTVPQNPVWIIDPLDGTTNFAHGFPWFGVSIAYASKGEPLAGVIYCPIQDELFIACRDAGAWLNNEKINVSGVTRLQDSLVATGFPYDIHKDPEPVVSAFSAVLNKAQDIRRAGSAALDLAYLACGRLDGFWEIKLKPWDTAAGQLLVEEAGGKITTLNGDQYNPFVPEILATNGIIHGELIDTIKAST